MHKDLSVSKNSPCSSVGQPCFMFFHFHGGTSEAAMAYSKSGDFSEIHLFSQEQKLPNTYISTLWERRGEA